MGTGQPDAYEAGEIPGDFMVYRSGDVTTSLDVNYTLSGTATAGSDYTTLSGTVTIPAFSEYAFVAIDPIDDTLVEGDETVVLTLTAGSNYTLGTFTQDTLTIYDDDTGVPSVSIQELDANATENSADTGTFRVTRFGSTSGNLVVSYTVAGTATPGIGNDYTTLAGSITILDGTSYADIIVTPLDDSLNEPDETVVVTLTDTAAYDLAPPTQGTVTIADDDTPPPLSTIDITADDNSASEPGANLGRYKISRGTDTTGNLTVRYTVTGTATAGSDYTALTGMATIPGGQTHIYVYVQVTDDNNVEPSETVILTLQSDASYTLGTSTTDTVTISDDDANVTILATDPNAAESGPDNGQFTLTRTGYTTGPLTVNYTITGTTTPSDYTQTLGGTITFAAGATTAVINITPVNDTLAEADELFTLTLAPGTGYETTGATPATVTIVDDDLAVPTIAAPGPTNTSDTTPTIDWNNVTGAATYELIVTENSVEIVNVTGLTNSDYTLTTRVAPNSYTAKVRAVSATKSSPWSSLYNFTLSLPNAPTITGPTSPTSDVTPLVTWTAPTTLPGASYQMQIYNVALGQLLYDAIGLTGTQQELPAVTIGNLNTSERYGDYQVFMRTANSEIAYGSFTSAYIFTLSTPDAPIVTGPPTPTADATPLITWIEPTALPGDSYQLQIYNVNLGTLVYDTTGLTGIQHEVTTALNAGYQYSAYMRTANTLGDYGTFSDAYLFDIILPAAPTVTAPSDPTADTTPVVTWTTVSGADWYNLLLYNVSSGQLVEDGYNIIGASYAISASLTYATNQLFVQSVNSAGESGPWSAAYNFDVVSVAPVATDDSDYNVLHGNTLEELDPGILLNDTDDNGDTLSVSLVTSPAQAVSFTLNSDGSFTYEAPANWVGIDSFTYTASDGSTSSNLATVSINVINTPPSSEDDTFVIRHGNTLFADAFDVLENDYDADGDDLTATLDTGPASASYFILNADGSFEYTPNGFSGTDSFTYYANDGAENSGQPATVTIQVINEVPVAENDYYSVVANSDGTTTLSVPISGVLANDWDMDKPPLTATLAIGPTTGSVTLNADGSFDYQVAGTFTGTDTFTYTVSDGADDSSVAIVSIKVYAADQPIVTSVTVSPYIIIGPDGGTSTVTATVRNDSTQSLAAGEYSLTFAVDGTGISIPNPTHALPALLPGETATVPLTGTDIVVSAGTAGGVYTVTAELAGSLIPSPLWLLQAINFDLQRLTSKGKWRPVKNDEVVWSHDVLRWTPLNALQNTAVTKVDWLKRPWDNPAAAWSVFATTPTLEPVESNPGVGVWAVTPQFQFNLGNGQFGTITMLIPRKVIVAEIVSVEWIGIIPPGGTSTNLSNDNPTTMGGGWRIYPDKNAPGIAGQPHSTVQVTVTVQPSIAGIPVQLKIMDADDPTDADGPIDNDPNLRDNRRRGSLNDRYIQTSVLLAGVSLADAVFTVGFNPGDNFRILAAPRRPDVVGIFPISSKLSPETEGRLYANEGGGPEFDGEDPVVDESNPRYINSKPVVYSTPLLTVWRRLNVEVDSMGSPPANTRFNADDLLRGNIANPNTAGLAAAFLPAFITVNILPATVTGITGTVSSGSIPFALGFANRAAMDNYFTGPNGQRATRNEEAMWWSVYVAGIYEYGDGFISRDNDVNAENVVWGFSRFNDANTSGWAVIPMEILRDLAAQHGWNAQQIATFQQVAVIHEIGHQFLLSHSGRLTNTNTINAMTVHISDADEANLTNLTLTTAVYKELDVKKIRKAGSNPLPNP